MALSNLSIMNDSYADQEFEENNELFEHYCIEVDPGQSFLRIDKFLNDRLQNVTRSKIQGAIRIC